MMRPVERALKAVKSKYNPKIHGLRGFSIFLVLMCHLEVSGFANGFIGVDIFFVISGFLITTTMSEEYISNRKATGRQGWISFVGFYSRRVRRILPAAIAVILLTVLFGNILNSLLKLKSGWQIDGIWAATFLANLNFMNQSTEYFGVAAQQSPFLHYWSLAVEEQFYLVWPTLFLAVTSAKGFNFLNRAFNWRKRLLVSIFSVCVLSFGIFVFQLFENSPTSYYSSIGRFWEFGIGALFALKQTNLKFPRILGLFVLLTNILVFFLFDAEAFRFFSIILLVSIGFLLFQFQNSSETSLISKILENRFLSYLGTISYSLYLVHWPVIVFLKSSGIDLSPRNLTWVIPIIFILSRLIFKEVESRFMGIEIPKVSKKSAARRTRYFPLNHEALKYAALFISFLIVLVNLQIGAEKPFIVTKFKSKIAEPWSQPQIMDNVLTPSDTQDKVNSSSSRDISKPDFFQRWQAKIVEGLTVSSLPKGLEERVRNLDAERLSNWEDCLTIIENNDVCNYGNPESSKLVMIIGDSYARSISPMIMEAFSTENIYVIVRTRAQCMVPDVKTSNLGKEDLACEQHRKSVNTEIQRLKPDLIVATSLNSNLIMADKKSLYIGMEKEFKFLVENSNKLIVIGETPFMKDPRNCIGVDGALRKCIGYSKSREEYRNMTKKAAVVSGAIYKDITPWFCLSLRCPLIIDNTFVTWDGGHITAELSRKIAPLFREFLITQGLVQGD